MPRGARKLSKSGYYHILLRGIGQQNIFEDDEDRIRFLDTLLRYKRELNFEVNSYCLMGNHVHLLLKDTQSQLDLIMKKLAGSYAYYFNRKYERVGHLFQDRFKSEAIEDDAYYLNVLRYIHQNPEKAGIDTTDKYRWSSYVEFASDTGIIDKEYALSLLGGFEKFKEFVTVIVSNEQQCLDISESNSITDRKAMDILYNKYELNSFFEIQKLGLPERNALLHNLKDEGMSIRQISRLTGINRSIVQRA